MVNPDAEIVFRENTADDPNRRKPDITKARSFSQTGFIVVTQSDLPCPQPAVSRMNTAISC